MLEHFDVTQVHETQPKQLEQQRYLLTQGGHLDRIGGTIPGFQSSTTKNYSLNDLGCTDGIATAISVPDAWISNSETGWVRCIWEVKHGTDTPAESLRQGFSEATNVALTLLRKGVDVSDICVPVISSNGRLFQFAETAMLEPAQPYLRVITKVLDIFDVNDREVAARTLTQITHFCQEELSTKTTTTGKEVELRRPTDSSQYFLKDLTCFFQVCNCIHVSLLLVDVHEKLLVQVYDCIHASLLHMFSILEVLYNNSTTKQYVVYPLTIITADPGPAGKIDDQLLFPFLHDYHIGLPKEKEVRKKFLDAVETAMKAFHEAG